MTGDNDDQYLPKRAVAQRYHVSAKTIERWTKAEKIAAPAFERNGRSYWSLRRLQECDQKGAA